MPELPEVETTCRGIRSLLEGSQLQQVIVRVPKLRWPVPKKALQDLLGEKIQKVYRRGKYIVIQCESASVIVHLGMSGRLYFVDRDKPSEKHDHVDFELNKDKKLRLTDPRRFGCVLVAQVPEEDERLKHLGVEPLTEAFSGSYLKQCAKNRRIGVKSLLMDGQVVVGVGNIYASESLFAAGIHPNRVAQKISLSRYDRLAAEVKQVLIKAIAAGGTTLKDFLNGSGKPGYFQQSLQVYDRKGEPCVKCGAAICAVQISQRTTYYCPQCQQR